MKALSVFRPRVASLAPTATDPMIDQAVLDACIDFCERTLVVKRMLTTFTTVAGTAAYTPAPPAQESIAQFIRVWCDSTELDPMNEDAISGPWGFVTTVTGQTNQPGLPQVYNETDPGLIQFYPRPNAVYTINARVALRPLRTATQVEDQLFEDWVEAITSGALARLYAQPGELLNPLLAKYHAANFQGFVDAAQVQASKGRVARAQQAVRPVHI